MTSIRIEIRSSYLDKKGTAPLRVVIRHKKNKKEITIPKIRTKPKYWDGTKEKITNNKDLTFKLKLEKNKYLNKLLDLQKLGVNYSIDNITGKTQLSQNENKTALRETLVVDYIDKFFGETSSHLSYGSHKQYKSLSNTIKEKWSSLRLHELDGSFLLELSKHYKDKGLKISTITKRCKNIKAIGNHAYQEDYLKEKPKWKGYKSPAIIPNHNFLSVGEVMSLQKYYVSDDCTDLESRVVRPFLFSCVSSGIRFSELCRLRYTDIRNHSTNEGNQFRLLYKMKKTQKVIDNPLNTTAMSFIDISKVGSNELVFGLVKNGINGLNEKKQYNRIASASATSNKVLKGIAVKIDIKRSISFHKSRSFFISAALSKGVELFTVSKMAGASIKVLEKHYATCFDPLKNKAASKLNLF